MSEESAVPRWTMTILIAIVLAVLGTSIAWEHARLLTVEGDSKDQNGRLIRVESNYESIKASLDRIENRLDQKDRNRVLGDTR